MPRFTSTETSTGESVSSSDNFFTMSSGGGGKIVHRYGFFAANALLQCMMINDHSLCEKMHLSISLCLYTKPASERFAISRILFPQNGWQSFLLTTHYYAVLATYPSCLLHKRIKRAIFSTHSGTGFTRSCSQWGLSCALCRHNTGALLH